MSTNIYCPKCQGTIEVDDELLTERILCQYCGQEFSLKEDKPSGHQMQRLGPGRAEMESAGEKKSTTGGAAFVLLMILIVLIAIVLGFVNFWVAIGLGIFGLLAGILVQLGRIANKK